MAVSKRNLLWRLSGGEDNTDPNASTGGPMSKTVVTSGMDNVFPDVTGDQARSGYTDVRCVYFYNADDDRDGLIDPVIWLSESAESGVIHEIGLDPAGKNGTASSDGEVIFSRPASKQGGTKLPDSPYLYRDGVPVWIRRTVLPGTKPSSMSFAIRLAGDTI